MDMMGSATLAKEYPVIAFMKKRQKNRPPQNKAKERDVIAKVYKRCGFDTTLLGSMIHINTIIYIYIYIYIY